MDWLVLVCVCLGVVCGWYDLVCVLGLDYWLVVVCISGLVC